MRKFPLALAILLGIGTAPVFAESPITRVYTEAELYKATEACYHEHGSSMLQEGYEHLYQEMLIKEVHTYKVRAETRDPYFRHDFGGPYLVKVIDHPRQYTYRQRPHGVPRSVAQDPFGLLRMFLNGFPFLSFLLPHQVAEPSLSEKVVRVGNVHEKVRWERCQRAVYAVFVRNVRPVGELAAADTYWHQCLLKEYRPAEKEKCGTLKLVTGAPLCWYTLEQVPIPGQLPMHRLEKHVFSRHVTPQEQRERLEAPLPPECVGHETYVEREIFSAWRYWLPAQEAALSDPAKADEEYWRLLREQSPRSHPIGTPASLEGLGEEAKERVSKPIKKVGEFAKKELKERKEKRKKRKKEKEDNKKQRQEKKKKKKEK